MHSISRTNGGPVLLSQVATHDGYGLAGVALLAIGLGNAGTSFAATVAGSAGVADREQGLAGGLINSSRQIGSALGVAVLLDVAMSVAAQHQVPAAAALATGCRTAFVVAARLAAAAFILSAALIPRHAPCESACLDPAGDTTSRVSRLLVAARSE